MTCLVSSDQELLENGVRRALYQTVRFELRQRPIARARMRVDLVVVPARLVDADFRFDSVPRPLQAEILVAKLPVEGFICGILPRLAAINQRRFDLRGMQPALSTRKGPSRTQA